jgi:hypothetical protein
MGQLGRAADASEHPRTASSADGQARRSAPTPTGRSAEEAGPGAAVSQPKVERTRTNDGSSAGVFCVRGSRPFGALRDRDAAEPSNAAMIRSAPRQRLARRRFCGTCSVWCFASVAWLSVAPVGIERVDPSVALRLASMATVIDAAAVEAVRAEVRELLGGIRAAAAARDQALVEQLALGFMVPFNLPDARPELAAVVVEELVRRGDRGAAGVLGAIAVFAHQPLAGLGSEGLARLHKRGVAAPVAQLIGTLEVSELRRVSAGRGASYYLIAVLTRLRSRRQQLVSVLIEPDSDGEVIVDGLVMPPRGPASVRRLLRKEAGPGGEPIFAANALERLRVAAEHMVDHGLVTAESVSNALPLLARALGGDARALPNLSYHLSDPSAPLPRSARAFTLPAHRVA